LYAYERKLNGTLEFQATGGESASILFVDGQPAKCRTSEPVAYLGSVLLELGTINDAQLNQSLADMARAKKLHGQILRDMGVLTEPKLKEGLKVQLARKIRHLAGLAPDTMYAYFDQWNALQSYGGPETISVDPMPLVWTAVREAPPWDHVHTALTKVGTAPLRLSRTAQLQRFEFEKRELDLIELFRSRPMRVADLVAAQILRPREAQLLVYLLLITKQAQVIVETGNIPPRLEPTPTARPSPAPVTPPNPEQANPMSFAMRAATTSRPSITPPAGPAPPLPPELAARRQQILERAAQIDREEYFEMLGVKRESTFDEVREAFFNLAKTWHPDRLPPQLADVKEACGRVFSRMSEAHATLSDGDKRAKYMKLMTEGGATPEAQDKIAAVVGAATEFQKAEICLRRNDYAQAEALVKKAYTADPQPEYLAMIAWIEALKPEHQSAAATQIAITKLDQAIRQNEKLERAYFWRGMLHKRLNNMNYAVRDFRKAAELNPRNIDAMREVRLFEMRKGNASIPPRPGSSPPKKGDDPKGGGLLGKLFKK
jgi:tetratricopeptide (TPR) repeat protein